MWTAKLGDAEYADRGYGKVSENVGEGERLSMEEDCGLRDSLLVFTRNLFSGDGLKTRCRIFAPVDGGYTRT